MIKFAALLSLVFTIVGCASQPSNPQARCIIASPNPAPKGCKYVSQVFGNQGNFFTGAWTSNRNLEEGAMNDLKNQAANLGANYIQLINSRAGNTGNMNSYNGNTSAHMAETNITNLGNAYLQTFHNRPLILA